jgi:hypothetical protein
MEEEQTFYGPTGEPFRWAPLFYVGLILHTNVPSDEPIETRTNQTPKPSSIGFLQSKHHVAMDVPSTFQIQKIPLSTSSQRRSSKVCLSAIEDVSSGRKGSLPSFSPTVKQDALLPLIKLAWRV